MVRVRSLFVAMAVCGVFMGTPTAQRPPQTPDAGAVIQKVRQTYRTLPGYHFQRDLLVEESASGGPTATLAELSLTIASESGKPDPEGLRSLPMNMERFRLSTKTAKGEQLQVCGAGKCWAYAAEKKEYMTGATFRDVNTSVGGAMLLAFHLFTFSVLDEGIVQNATVVRREDVQVGSARRRCLVVEGEIPAVPLRGPGGSMKPPSPASLGVSWFLTGLRLTGLVGTGTMTGYSPWPDEKTDGVGESTRVTLWIDENTHVIVKSRMGAQVYKRTLSKEPQPGEQVGVTITDTFTIAAVTAPPDDLFRFTPPEGATEVPNAALRREKREGFDE